MSPDDIPSAKNSSFLSLFSRKKRINRSITESLDDNKTITSTSNVRFLTNGQKPEQKPTNITHTNGYDNLENSEMLMVPLESASTSWAKEFQLSHQSLLQQQQPKTDFAFPDRKRYYQNSRMHQHISTENSDILSNNNRSRSESRAMTDKSPILLMSKKAYSVDTMNNHSDPGYLMEALETLADTQPRVARSIPKHAVVDTSNFAARSLDNCLFDATVYDAMLHDSLKVCEMLQNHLNQCIVAVRTNCSNGYLKAVTEEREKDTEKTCNQGDQCTDSRYQTTVLNSSLITSSNHDGTLNCPIERNGQLKTEVRIKKDY